MMTMFITTTFLMFIELVCFLFSLSLLVSPPAMGPSIRRRNSTELVVGVANVSDDAGGAFNDVVLLLVVDVHKCRR